MQISQQPKSGGFSQRPTHSGDRPRGNDWRWSEQKAYEEIEKSFGQNGLAEILSDQKKDYNEYINKVKSYVKGNAHGITTSQLRNIFSQVKNVSHYEELYTLRPKLAYVSGRAEKDQTKTLLFLFDALISKVSNASQLEQFKAFFEAVIAYHKYFGGKE